MKIKRDSVLILCIFSLLLSGSVLADVHSQYEISPSNRQLMKIGRYQTIENLVPRLYPQYPKLWPRIIKVIRQINTHAINQYTGKLIVGEKLKLVTINRIYQAEKEQLPVAGKVSELMGQAGVQNQKGSQALKIGNPVYSGDRITTAENSRLILEMEDGAEIHLKPASSIRLTDYQYKPNSSQPSRSILDLVKGGLRTITGAIGADPRNLYRLHTGVVTIGIRGTDYVAMLCKPYDCLKPAGRNDTNTFLHVAVINGAVLLTDQEQLSGELSEGQYAVMSEKAKVMVEEDSPVDGFFSEDETRLFNEARKEPPFEGIWPWIVGGVLLGFGL